MDRILRKCFVGLVVVASAAIWVPTAEAAKCSKAAFSPVKSSGVVTVTVNWANVVYCRDNEKEKDLGARVDMRVSEDNPVDLLVTDFNFINYTISYKVDETVVETYVMLEKLWSQLLGIPIFGTPSLASPGLRAHLRAEGCKGFQQCGANWALKIATVQIVLSEYLEESAGKTTVNKERVASHDAELKEHRQDIKAMLKLIVDDAGNRPNNIQEVTQFETVLAKQEKLFEKLDAYSAAAELVANGQVHHLGKKKAGTIVSVSLTPRDQNQAEGRPVTTCEYFVHSKLPVVFHAGYSHTKLNAVRFETVRSLQQTDLFSEVRDSGDSLNSMVAFLSLGQSFLTDQKLGAFFSIGTDFAEPGDRLYIGLSMQLFKRFFLTAGRVSATVTQGVNPVFERVGNAIDSRELFTAIATHRDWKTQFYSVSFRVF